MMKYILLLSFLLVSCHSEKEPAKPNALKASTTTSTDGEDDFSDLKKDDDESCDTEEDLEAKLQKKIEESQNKGEGLKLQGSTDPGCEID